LRYRLRLFPDVRISSVADMPEIFADQALQPQSYAGFTVSYLPRLKHFQVRKSESAALRRMRQWKASVGVKLKSGFYAILIDHLIQE
jgi:hypothetical protein